MRASIVLTLLLFSSPTLALPPMLVSSRLGNQVLRYDGNGAPQGAFAVGRPLLTPNGMVYGPDGHLYVSSRDGNQVLRYNGATGVFMNVFAQGPEMLGPSDLLFGPNGDLYVTNSLAANISRYNGVTGALVRTFGHPSLINPIGLAFAPDGLKLYVSSVPDRLIMTFNPDDGAFLATVASGNVVPSPADLAFGPDGLLYAAHPTANAITRYNPQTGQTTALLTGVAALGAPTSLEFAEDRLFVGSFVGDKVLVLNRTTGAILGEHIATGAGGLDGPQYIRFVPEPVGTNALLIVAQLVLRRQRR